MDKRKPKGWVFNPYPYSSRGKYSIKYYYETPDCNIVLYVPLLVDGYIDCWIADINIYRRVEDSTADMVIASVMDNCLRLPIQGAKRPPFKEALAMADLIRSSV